jgi:S-(hydroxymethyl)glutathione dehydrogenase/alcohol dehydrogenase
MTRRSLLKSGAPTFAAATAIGADASAQSQSAPAIQSGTNAGRRFRGFVRHGTGIGLEDLKLKAIQPRQVVVRSEAAAPCYTSVRGALGTNQARRATIPNHCGLGVVEAVGPEVRRVQRGDRVVIAGTSQCGTCYQCLHGRPDYCQFTSGGDDFPPFAEMTDGTPVYGEAGIGGFSELMVVYEEYCVPVFTDVSPAELCLLGDQLTSGFAAGQSLVRFEPGSDVVVFGAGPVGIGAIQAGGMGAAQVISIEPIDTPRVRAENGRDAGDRSVAEGTNSSSAFASCARSNRSALCRRHELGEVALLRPVSAAPTSWSKRRDFRRCRQSSSAARSDKCSTVRQAWDCTRMGGHTMLMGFTLQEVSFPGPALALLGRTIHPGQQGGLHMMRDIPRFVRLIEKGKLDAKSMITKTYTVNEMRQAWQDCGDRSIIAGVVLFT